MRRASNVADPGGDNCPRMPRKVANLRANPRVMLALGEADDDFDVGLLEGVTEVVERGE